MIALIQRVKHASVTVDNHVIGSIKQGMLVFVGVEKTDTPEVVKKLVHKLLKFRMFSDDDGKMNLNVQAFGGAVLAVSQFTLVADTSKGNRPGFSNAASPEFSEMLYEQLIADIRLAGIPCETGQFGADMQVELLNDGPVTFQLHVS